MFISLLMTQSTGDFVLNFFKQFIGTPALLIALFALVGSLLQRKKFTDVISSTIKTAVGFLIIGGGAGILAGAVGKLGNAFRLLFGVNGAIANNDVIPGLLMNIPGLVTAGALIMIVAMCLNLLLARITGFKYIYLTGHVLFYLSTMFASIMYIGMSIDATHGFDYAAKLPFVVISGALLMSTWMIISPAILNKHVVRITKSNNLAMAHSGSLSYFCAAWIGELVGWLSKGRIKSTESIRFPKGLAFLRNTNVAISITMFVVYLIVFFTTWGVRGYDAMSAPGNLQVINPGDDVFVQGVLQAFTFAAGVEVLLIGVRMFIAEIVPAFKGISERFVPNSKPALDCPTVFPYAPNAVLIGFISSFIGGIIGMVITIAIVSSLGHQSPDTIGWAVIIPGIVPHFFLGATCGVFANTKGGIIGTLVASFINGLVITFVPFLFFGLHFIQPITDTHGALSNMVWGDSDFLLGLPFAAIGQAVGPQNSGWVILLISIVIWLILPVFFGIKFALKMRNPEFRVQYKTTNMERKLQLKADLEKQQENEKQRRIKEEQNQLKKIEADKVKQQAAYEEYLAAQKAKKELKLQKKEQKRIEE